MPEFTVKCTCGKYLDAEFSSFGKGEPEVVVEPCHKCMDKAHSEGYEQREKEGFSE